VIRVTLGRDPEQRQMCLQTQCFHPLRDHSKRLRSLGAKGQRLEVALSARDKIEMSPVLRDRVVLNWFSDGASERLNDSASNFLRSHLPHEAR